MGKMSEKPKTHVLSIRVDDDELAMITAAAPGVKCMGDVLRDLITAGIQVKSMCAVVVQGDETIVWPSSLDLIPGQVEPLLESTGAEDRTGDPNEWGVRKDRQGTGPDNSKRLPAILSGRRAASADRPRHGGVSISFAGAAGKRPEADSPRAPRAPRPKGNQANGLDEVGHE